MRDRISAVPAASINSLEVHEFIYHIMIQGTSLPEYLKEVSLTFDQRKFFTEMIQECTKGTQYIFDERNKEGKGEEESLLSTWCNEITQDPKKYFESNSKKIAKDFLRFHPNTAVSGILIVSRVTMEIDTETKSFIAIIKVDYTKVLQQIRNKNDNLKVSFKEISDSLAENKSAIQKRALIDVNNIFKWDALAVERGRVGKKLDSDKAITDYFERFLGVKLLANDSVYSRRVPSLVSKWAGTVEGLSKSEAKATAVALINAHDGQVLSMDDIAVAVCAHENEDVHNERLISFKNFMGREENAMEGVQFVARPASIPDSDKVNCYRTNKHVIVKFEGSPESNGIEITSDNKTGEKLIIIRASKIDELS